MKNIFKVDIIIVYGAVISTKNSVYKSHFQLPSIQGSRGVGVRILPHLQTYN